ncbi:MAG: InlB B-repeat-containing protein [Tepidanaerobacteraceae bacterium]|nr:InlB B-repeat-containing protein [Tepidanaerobacteraceae bacterium]
MNFKKIGFVCWVMVLSMIMNLFIGIPAEVYADGSIESITVVSNIDYSATGNSQVIDPELTIAGIGNIYSATVNIDNGFSEESGDILSCNMSMAADAGLSAEYNSESGVLTVSGMASVNAYQEVLRTVAFQTNAVSGTRTIVFLVNTSDGKVIYYDGTGHYYEFVNAPGISWHDAKAAAEARYYDGHQGYLATITSQGENDFVTSKCDGAGWLGASDEETEGVWKWVTGPEAGTQFWQGNENGSPVGGQYNNWKTGLEPNNDFPGEDYLHIMGKNLPYWAWNYKPGDWNDFPLSTSTIQGYVVEYGGEYIDLSASSISAVTNVTIYSQQSSENALISVAGQTDSTPAGGNGNTPDAAIIWYITLPNEKETIGLADISVSENASKNLYRNSDFTGEAAGDDTIALTAGSAATVYIKVTAEDRTTVRYYAVTINRDIAQHTVSFEENGGSEVADQTVNHNERAAEPAEPTRIGYTFEGWYADEGLTVPYDFDAPVTGDITLYAKWISNGEAYVIVDPNTIKTGSYTHKEFLLILENDSIKRKITDNDLSLGGVFSDLKVEVLTYTNTTVTASVYESVYGSVYRGFDQKGIGEIIINPEVLDKSETPLVAKVTVKGEYTVRFLDDKGNVLKEEDIVSGKGATAPVPPEKEGYVFIGWDKEFGKVSSDLTATAQYEIKKCIIKYIGSDISEQAVNYKDKAVKPAEPTRAGYTFGGWYSDENFNIPYDFDAPVTDDITLYAKWIKNSKTKSGGRETDKAGDGISVVVNGQSQTAGKEVVKENNNLKQVEIYVEAKPVIQKIEEVLRAKQGADQTDNESSSNIVEIPVKEKEANSVTTKLTGETLKQMEANKFNLSINTGEINFIIPAKEINIENVAKILGADEGALDQIEIEIKIDKLEKSFAEQIKKQAEQKNYEVVLSPVDFRVVAQTKTGEKENKFEIANFNQYVKRIVAIPEGVDPNKITTGVVYNSDGSFSHVPTYISIKHGKYYAEINSLTDSIYSVIWNPVTVKSVENHWSKGAVNDMASRLIIGDPDEFIPDNQITRAEFAEYIVKAMGVYRIEAVNEIEFNDVDKMHPKANAIKTAIEYGIVKGYPDGSFKPDQHITRAEAMVMYSRAMDIVGLIGSGKNRIDSYEDKDSVPVWAYEHVKKVVSAKVFNGNDELKLLPLKSFTYAEAAQAIRNLLTETNLINQ